jgi:glycosyltransferase involved in cell wall biosynthesis
MPTYNQAAYIRNAIRSLLAQTYPHWELIIVNDGCTDNTEEFINDYLQDERITYIKNKENEGLGASINKAMDIAKYDHIAYLPSDDFYYNNHLEVLADQFTKYPDAVLVTTAMQSELMDSLLHRKNQMINGHPHRLSIQLVQTAHAKTGNRWVERKEWESIDLYLSFFNQLVKLGLFINCLTETCQWVIHSYQRYKILSETYSGNVNRFRQYYHILAPLKIKVSEHRFLDEEKQFEAFRQTYTKAKNGLKILLVGELSYNQERIVALEEAGHQLYGLWTQSPTFSFSNVGHLPFGHVKDIDYEHWEEEVKRVQPDIIYALTNFCAVPIAYEVLSKNLGIPFVWHFKEGPFLCFEHEYWQQLIHLYTKADGIIFLNEEYKKWMLRYIPDPPNSIILDGDYPKQDYFTNDFSPKLSEQDGEIHTVVSGRMVGLTIKDIKTMADNHIHLHWYNESYEEAIIKFTEEARRKAPNHFHDHKHCSPTDWTHEFSKYDAGWLHVFESANYGNLDKASWNDLNLPARISTMMAAGLPCIQKDNSQHIVAMQSCLKSIDCGIFYKDINDLAKQLQNRRQLKKLQRNAMQHRQEFCFDSHVPELIDFFRKTINRKKNANNK